MSVCVGTGMGEEPQSGCNWLLVDGNDLFDTPHTHNPRRALLSFSSGKLVYEVTLVSVCCGVPNNATLMYCLLSDRL